MASPISFFSQHPLPIFGFLSAQSLEALGEYLSSGNRTHRERQLLEFFRSVDWMSLKELQRLRHNPLRRLSFKQQTGIYQDIQSYFSHKTRQRAKRAEQRKSHKLRVFEYFRQHVPRKDKELLEQLRDFELEMTGWDKNWQHYFAMHSFKKIDAFLRMDNAQRLQLIQRFKRDVLTYKKNLEKLRQAQEEQARGYSFDDWCETADREHIFDSQRQRHYRQYKRGQHATSPAAHDRLKKDFRFMGLSQSASLDQVKKQFRQLTLSHHPDVPGGCPNRMKELLAAYDRIKRHLSRV